MKKVLIVSHNIFCQTSNMGKTLLSYFKEYDTENLAQFYIHSEVPTDNKCKNYFRITDKDILKSIFNRKSGNIFAAGDINCSLASSRTDTGITGEIYQKARKRTPLIYFLRNLIWDLGKWNTKNLRNWLDDFNPEAVFFASGDYAFMYKIALKIAKYKQIPLYISCMDDYYIYNKNECKIGGNYIHKLFMKQVKRTMDYASGVFCICDKMSDNYSKLFNKPCYTIHTPAAFVGPLVGQKSNRISYIGNLGYKRNEQLLKIGRALKSIECEGKPNCIDVYSSEIRPEILKDFTKENGINFCGEISAERVKDMMAESMLLIHTESFEGELKKALAYSVSTKIADSLASGTCILAFGPDGIASMDYLKSNSAAYCICDENELNFGLNEIISDYNLREKIVSNALDLANKNHNPNNLNCINEII